MPPVAAIGAGLAGAAGGIGGAVGGIASGIGGLAGGAGGLGSLVSGAGSLLSSAGGLGGGGGGGADPMAMYAAQIQQAQLANLQRQKISDRHFKGLIDKKRKGGKTRYGNENKLLFGQSKEDVFGRRPEYYEVDFQTMLDQDPGLAGTARDVTEGNLDNFARNSRLADATNQFLTNDARNRANSFDPFLMGNIEQTGRNAALAAQGILPQGDAEQIRSNRSEMGGIYGTAGTSRGQTARDLGLSRLDLMTRVAPSLMAQNTNLINTLTPAQLRADPRASQVSTQQALQIGAADNQFEATFDRNEQSLRSLLEAAPDPAAQGMFDLQNTLRAQQFAIDFGLAGGYGSPGTMPDNLGEGGMLGFTGGLSQAGSAFQSIGGLLGGGSGFGTPGIFG